MTDFTKPPSSFHNGFDINLNIPKDTVDPDGLTQESLDIYNEYSFLKDYRKYLGNIARSDIVGSGRYGITIRKSIGTSTRILKIGNSKQNSDALKEEHDAHILFYEKIEELKSQGKIPSWLKVPIVFNSSVIPVYSNQERFFIYEMECIEGSTYNGLHIRDTYDLKKYPELITEEMQEKFLLAQKIVPNIGFACWGFDIPYSELEKEYADKVPDQYNQEIHTQLLRLFHIIQKYCPDKHDEFIEAFLLLEGTGYIHGDLDPKNVMYGNDGNIYIIDFGQSIVYN